VVSREGLKGLGMRELLVVVAVEDGCIDIEAGNAEDDEYNPEQEHTLTDSVDYEDCRKGDNSVG